MVKPLRRTGLEALIGEGSPPIFEGKGVEGEAAGAEEVAEAAEGAEVIEPGVSSELLPGMEPEVSKALPSGLALPRFPSCAPSSLLSPER